MKMNFFDVTLNIYIYINMYVCMYVCMYCMYVLYGYRLHITSLMLNIILYNLSISLYKSVAKYIDCIYP